MTISHKYATASVAWSPIQRLLTLTMLLLAFSVFFWGLHDKLSLYAPPSVPPPSARAKLLSASEQSSTQAAAVKPMPPRTVEPVLLELFAAFLVLLLVLPGNAPESTLRVPRPQTSPPLPAQRRRPPPSLTRPFPGCARSAFPALS